MPKLTPAGILSIVVALIGVFFFIAATTGMLFAEATSATDPGLWSVVIVFVALGLLGLWASMAEAKESE